MDRTAAIQAAAAQVQRDMLSELQSIFQLFAMTSSSKTAPGDKYLAEMKYLSTELAAVKAAQASSPRGVSWGISTMNLTPLTPTPGVTPNPPSGASCPILSEKIRSLEAYMKNIEA